MTQPAKPGEPQELSYRVDLKQSIHADAGKEVHLWGTGGLLVALGFFCWVLLFLMGFRPGLSISLFVAGFVFIFVGLLFLVVWAIRGTGRRR